jgi:hypothetical protein
MISYKCQHNDHSRCKGVACKRTFDGGEENREETICECEHHVTYDIKIKPWGNAGVVISGFRKDGTDAHMLTQDCLVLDFPDRKYKLRLENAT